MADEIVGSLIGAAASVIVALIGANAQRPKKKPEHVPNQPPPLDHRNSTPVINKHKRTWVVVILISLGWIILSPILIHPDLAGSNMFVVGAMIILLAFLQPVNPLTPVTLSIALLLLAVFMEPITRYLKYQQSMHLSGPEGLKWTPVVEIIVVVALVSGLIDYLRLKKFK